MMTKKVVRTSEEKALLEEGGFDEFAQGQMTLIKNKMIDPLKRMKRKCDRFRPTWY